jgi:hypothetical protein
LILLKEPVRRHLNRSFGLLFSGLRPMIFGNQEG